MRLAAKSRRPFLVDFAAFENLSRVGEAPLHTIAKSIEKTSAEHWESVEWNEQIVSAGLLAGRPGCCKLRLEFISQAPTRIP